MHHLITGCDLAIQTGHNTKPQYYFPEQKWWHGMYTESLYKEREKYIRGQGRLKLY